MVGCRFEEMIEEVAVESVKSHFISPRDGVWLLRLVGERADPTALFLPFLDDLVARGSGERPGVVELIEEIASWIARDIPIGSRPEAAKRIIRWSEKAGMSGSPGISALRSVAEMDERREASEETGSPNVRLEFRDGVTTISHPRIPPR